MKVFISWSGDRSHQVATALNEWIPVVLQYVKPWMSDDDIAAGQRWSQEIATELEGSNFGILCTTPENQLSPWLLFEAGALAKSFEAARVVPALFGMDLRELATPLSQFQGAKLDKAGTLRILQSIQAVSDSPLQPDQLQTLFGTMWPMLEDQLKGIPAEVANEPAPRAVESILDDLVESNSLLAARVGDLLKSQLSLGSDWGRERGRDRHRDRFELMHFADETLDRMDLRPTDPLFLLTWASILRESLPSVWVLASAVAEDTYGERKSRSAETRLRQLADLSARVNGPSSRYSHDEERALHLVHEAAVALLMRRREMTHAV